jgi:hypothetical protein
MTMWSWGGFPVCVRPVCAENDIQVYQTALAEGMVQVCLVGRMPRPGILIYLYIKQNGAFPLWAEPLFPLF